MRKTKLLSVIAGAIGLWSTPALPQFPDMVKSMKKSMENIEAPGKSAQQSVNPAIPAGTEKEHKPDADNKSIGCENGYVEYLGMNNKNPRCISSENVKYSSEWELKGLRLGRLTGESIDIIKNKCRKKSTREVWREDFKRTGKGGLLEIMYICTDSDNSRFEIYLTDDMEFSGFTNITLLRMQLSRVPQVSAELPVAQAITNKYDISPKFQSGIAAAYLEWPGPNGLSIRLMQTNGEGSEYYHLTLGMVNEAHIDLVKDLAIKRRKNAANELQDMNNKKSINTVPRL